MAEKKSRPIRIEIPEELNFTQNEIDALELAFKSRLVDVESDVYIDAQSIDSINTTKLAVEVEVIASKRRRATKKSAKKARQSTKK